jgi:uncharacterized membrane protein
MQNLKFFIATFLVGIAVALIMHAVGPDKTLPLAVGFALMQVAFEIMFKDREK